MRECFMSACFNTLLLAMATRGHHKIQKLYREEQGNG